jgi:hypothetical protein
MPVQPQLFPDSDAQSEARGTPLQGASGPTPLAPTHDSSHDSSHDSRNISYQAAPIWLQRISLCVLVLFCVYLGVLVMVLPWWTRMWDQNMFFEARPHLARVMHLGAVRGAISGLGLLDIWIGISEAVHYRETRG